MNLYNNFNKQEKDLLAEANVTIENKEYSKDECKNMNKYNEIIEKLR